MDMVHYFCGGLGQKLRPRVLGIRARTAATRPRGRPLLRAPVRAVQAS